MKTTSAARDIYRRNLSAPGGRKTMAKSIAIDLLDDLDTLEGKAHGLRMALEEIVFVSDDSLEVEAIGRAALTKFEAEMCPALGVNSTAGGIGGGEKSYGVTS